MVDPQARRILRDGIRDYVCGRINNHRMFSVSADVADSPDLAVREIGEFWGSTVNSDLSTFRLGRSRIEPELWDRGARCILFLHSSEEYSWPSYQDDLLLSLAAGCSLMLGIPAAIAVSVCAVGLLVQADVGYGLAFIGLALLTFAASAFFLIWNERASKAEQRRVQSAGDISVWPFISSAAMDSVRRQLQLLPGSATNPAHQVSEWFPS